MTSINKLVTAFPNGINYRQFQDEINSSGLVCNAINLNNNNIDILLSNTPNSADLLLIDDLILSHIPEPKIFNELTFKTVIESCKISNKSIYADSTAGNLILTLPRIQRTVGGYIAVKKIVSANTVTIQAMPGETINGESTSILTVKNSFIMIYNNGVSWVDAVAIKSIPDNDIILSVGDTKGDISVESGTGQVALSVGSNGQVLTADSTQPLGIKWDTPTSGSNVLSTDIPSLPVTGLKMFSSDSTGFQILSSIDPIGIINQYQTSLFTRDISIWKAQGNGNTIFLMGFGNSTTGTVTTRSVASNNLFTQTRRVGYVSTATAGSSAGTRHGAQQFWRGNQPNLGGFLYVSQFGLSSASSVATQRAFVGLIASTATLSNQDPSHSSNKNIIGFGVDSGDSSWTFMHNDNSGQPIKEPLTGTFPLDQSVSLFESRIYSPPNGNTIYYSLRVLGGSFYSSSISTVIPSQSTFLSPIIWTNNGSTASAVGIDVVFQYIERF